LARVRDDIRPIVTPRQWNEQGLAPVNPLVKRKPLGAALLIGGMVSVVALTLWVTTRPKPDVVTVVAQIQEIGELRTVRHRQAFAQRVTSHWEPSSDWAWVPGLAAAGRAATENRALLSIVSEVDAAVDLTKAEVSQSGSQWKVSLPGAVLCDPVVTGTMENHDRGLLWKDSSIALTGLDKARVNSETAALSHGVIRQAEDHAVELIGGILAKFGANEAQICFRRASGAWEDCRVIPKEPKY
jgi:hypothetical protein